MLERCQYQAKRLICKENIRDQSEEANHKGMLRLELHRQPLVLGLEVLRRGIRTRTVCHCARRCAEIILLG
jgi:hypothetical protein